MAEESVEEINYWILKEYNRALAEQKAHQKQMNNQNRPAPSAPFIPVDLEDL